MKGRILKMWVKLSRAALLKKIQYVGNSDLQQRNAIQNEEYLYKT